MSKRTGKRRYAAKRPTNRPATLPVTATATPRPADLAEEYRYVYSDLRRLGILAAVMFALLVALALMAQYLV